MPEIELRGIDYAILGVYFAFVIGIGWWLRSSQRTSEDFFLSGRSIPAWVAGLAFLSANLGAQEVIGMAASGAKYGMATSHFYWVGAARRSSRRSPKMLFPFLVIVPGMIAVALTSSGAPDSGFHLPAGADGKPDYNLVIPAMLAHYSRRGCSASA